MIIDKDKPHLLPERKDPVGVVIDAFISNDRKAQEGQASTGDLENSIVDITMNAAWPRADGVPGNPPPIPDPGTTVDQGIEQKINEANDHATEKLNQLTEELVAALKAHTDKTGKVHGETKTTVGLSKKDNFPMGTIEEQKAGLLDNVFCSPAGIRAIVESRIKVDPRSYLPARAIPISSGGIFGDVPMWPYDCEVGEIGEANDPYRYFGNTPFCFSTPSGMMIFPTMVNTPVHGKFSAPPQGTLPIVQLAWGGTKVRVYNKRIDIRRSRPSYLRAWGNADTRGELLRGSRAMFNPNCAYYMEGANPKIRSFNKVELPFDVYDSMGTRSSLFTGVMHSSNGFLVNMATQVANNVWPGETTKQPFIMFEYPTFKMNLSDLDIVAGPPLRATETTVQGGTQYPTTEVTVPTHGKIIKSFYWNALSTVAIIPFKKLINTGSVNLDDWWGSLDAERTRMISFGWRNKMRMSGPVRMSLGWHNKNKTKYWHSYIDLEIEFRPNQTTQKTDIILKTGPEWDMPLQTLNDNWDVVGTGLFREYAPTPVNDPMHPLVLSGVFESRGGHLKIYTFYNRQYIGYYEHSLTKPLEFNDLGRNPPPNPTKYSYNAQSTINSDGMHGDHLRHIPVKIENSGKLVTYLTKVRDYRNRYRWCMVQTDNDVEVVQGRRYQNYIGPTILGLNWINDEWASPPSFLIENDDISPTMNVNNMVFTTKGGFKNKTSFMVNDDVNNPLTFSGEVSIHGELIDWINNNAGGWIRNNKLFFYMKGDLYWINQCTDPREYPADGRDMFYGIFRNCYINIDEQGKSTIRTRNPIPESVSLDSVNVMTKASLEINHAEILGYDPFESLDVYAMKIGDTGTAVDYAVSIPVAPFNNFYLDFKIRKDTLTEVHTFGPNLNAQDPMFPLDPVKGYQIDYDKVIRYGDVVPHRLHANMQSPVMMTKGMWRLARTPGDYAFYTRRHGNVKITGGVMGTFEGVTTHPMGSVLLINGKNTVVKAPIIARLDSFPSYEEFFLRMDGSASKLVGKNKDGARATIGAVPVGWLNGGEYSYYDVYSWRNSSFPVVDGKRMCFGAYGNTFPVLFGRPGSGVPVNRYFLRQQVTTMKWDTAQGRVIPIKSPNNCGIVINGTSSYQSNGAQSFTIPATHTGVITVSITRLQTVKWGPGLTELVSIGEEVYGLDFSGSTGFTVTARLPKRIWSLAGLLKGATGASYPGLETWDVSSITDFSEMLMNTTTFNMTLNWNMANCRNFARFAKGAKAFNKPIDSYGLGNAVTLEEAFAYTDVFNQPITLTLGHCRSVKGLFRGAKAYNSVLDGMGLPQCSDASYMLAETLVFNKSINGLMLPAVEDLTGFLKDSVAYATDLNVSYPVARSVQSFFENAVAFNNSCRMFLPVCWDWRYMFKGTKQFNQQLPRWTFAHDSMCDEMFAWTEKFNQDIDFSMIRVKSIYGMFRGAKAFQRPISNWVLTNIENAGYVFANSSYNQPLVGWVWPNENSGNKISATGMFYTNPEFNQDISYWDTSRFWYMTGMFRNASPNIPSKFNQPIGKWNYSNVISLSGFLWLAVAFDQDMSNIDVRNCQDLSNAFRELPLFKSDVSRWKVGNCTNFGSAFRQCPMFNSPMNNWDMSKATTIEDMFNGCVIFNQLINAWNVSNVIRFNGVLLGCKKYNQPMNLWNVSNGEEMGFMFGECEEFDQDIEMWAPVKATRMLATFRNAKKFNRDLSRWPVSNVANHTDFDLGATAWVKPRPKFPS